MSHREKAQGRPRTGRDYYIFRLAWEHFGVPPDNGGGGWGEGGLGFSASAAPETQPWKIDD